MMHNHVSIRAQLAGSNDHAILWTRYQFRVMPVILTRYLGHNVE